MNYKLFDIKPQNLQCEETSDSCVLNFDGNISLLWGRFEFMRSKIIKFNQIIASMSFKSNMESGCTVDMRLFENGKTYVFAKK